MVALSDPAQLAVLDIPTVLLGMPKATIVPSLPLE
jgi:hypothetical protein